MAANQAPRRFKINPVEFAIFSVVCTIFLNSVYNLFYDWRGFRSTASVEVKLGSESQAPRSPASLGASMAAVPTSFINMGILCQEEMEEQKVTANKVRISGPFCGISAPQDHKKLLRTEVMNEANQISATVFTDFHTGRFSTDYIPLQRGKNTIQIKFVYQGGKVGTKTVQIQKQ